MEDHTHFQQLIEGVALQFAEILKNSSQGIYIYLADDHKVCNKKFSDMLGYKSPAEWAKNEDSFTDVFVKDDSAKKLVGAYTKAMKKMIGSQIKMTWMKKSGENIKTEVILVPIAYDGHIFALHFVTTL
jgi:hypothetical protein